MTLLDGVLRRGLENPAVPLTDAAVSDYLGARSSVAGRSVSERTALQMGAVWRCVNINSNVPSSLPLHAYKKGSREVVESPLMEEPHPELTALEVWRLTYVHKNLWGNAFVQKVRNRGGDIAELWPITPDRVHVVRDRPSSANPSGKLFSVVDDWGHQQVLTSRDIMHLPGLGYDGVCGVSPVRMATEAIGMGLSAEEFGGRLFANGSLMSGILQTETRLDKEAADRLKAQWRAKVSGMSNAHDIAILDSGASFQSVSMPNKDTQFIESRQFQIYEMARFFGVPPFLLFETSKSTSWGTGLEQQAMGWIQFDLNPAWLAPHEARLTKELLRPEGLYAKYAVQGLLRGDSMSRAQFYRTLRDVGAMSANDIRELEDRAPIEGEGGDVYLQPMNYVPLGTEPGEYQQQGGQQRLPDDDDGGGPEEGPADDDSDEEDEA